MPGALTGLGGTTFVAVCMVPLPRRSGAPAPCVAVGVPAVTGTLWFWLGVGRHGLKISCTSCGSALHMITSVMSMPSYLSPVLLRRYRCACKICLAPASSGGWPGVCLPWTSTGVTCWARVCSYGVRPKQQPVGYVATLTYPACLRHAGHHLPLCPHGAGEAATGGTWASPVGAIAVAVLWVLACCIVF
jgi:hypothetical protein